MAVRLNVKRDRILVLANSKKGQLEKQPSVFPWAVIKCYIVTDFLGSYFNTEMFSGNMFANTIYTTEVQTAHIMTDNSDGWKSITLHSKSTSSHNEKVLKTWA